MPASSRTKPEVRTSPVPGSENPDHLKDLSAKGDLGLQEQLMTAEQACKVVGIAYNTLMRKAEQGYLHPYKVGRRTFYHPREVENLRELVHATRIVTKPSFKGATTATVPEKKTVQAPLVSQTHRPHPSTINYDGETAAAATEQFDEGASIRDVVRSLKISYELAEHLYEHWKAAGPELHLSAKQVALLANRFDWHDSPPTVEGLLRAINRFLEGEVTRAVKEALADVQKQAEAAVAAQKSDKPASVVPIGTEQEIPDAERALIEAAEREAALDDEADEPPKP